MHKPFIIDTLLVSAPNKGGVALLSNGNVTVLDRCDSTGLWISDTTIYRNTIIETSNSKLMQLKAITGPQKKVFANDTQYDFHDVLHHKGKLYLVSTGTNEVIVFDTNGLEVERYTFPGGNDSWHINCLGIWEDRIVLSAFGEFEEHRGYKRNSKNQGFILDLEANKKLWEGLSQPHTPVQYGDNYYICNSEEMQVLRRNRITSKIDCIQLDGYTRGIAFSQHYMYIGLSQSRNNSNAGSSNQARILALNLQTHEVCGEIHLPFAEIYDIRLLENLAILPSISNLMNLDLLHERSLRYVALESEFNNMHDQFERINSHFIVGKLLQLLRWLKKDNTFGNSSYYTKHLDN